MPAKAGERCRNLVLVLGDQLSHANAALDGVDPSRDVVWMAEVREETEHVPAHKRRIAVFFAAMRHFRDELVARGQRVRYTAMPRRPADDRGRGFAEVLRADVQALRPARLVVSLPGDHRVLLSLEQAARAQKVPLELRSDRRFFTTPEEFAGLVGGKKRLVMETFYRELRRRHRVLIARDGEPIGGKWNYDPENRASFGRGGPGKMPPVPGVSPDAVTKDVLALVQARFADHPGSLADFALPVTARQARRWLDDFVRHRLPHFGRYEDAMWTGQPVLYHSRLSYPLNLGLLEPRACVDAAVAAYEAGHAPLASVEGFVRQILGWREFVRGVYWRHMPGYQALNALDCEDRQVPRSFWTGETDMVCVREAMRSVIAHGYAHHIHRLMVLGELSLLLGVHPRRFHDWHMAMYLDAVDWVSLPNALGMSQWGDGGIVGTKPYVASGRYIDRMSNYCGGCRYDPRKTVGEDACPYNALYWDFLARHRGRFARNPRMVMQLGNLDRKRGDELVKIRRRADYLRAGGDGAAGI